MDRWVSLTTTPPQSQFAKKSNPKANVLYASTRKLLATYRKHTHCIRRHERRRLQDLGDGKGKDVCMTAGFLENTASYITLWEEGWDRLAFKLLYDIGLCVYINNINSIKKKHRQRLAFKIMCNPAERKYSNGWEMIWKVLREGSERLGRRLREVWEKVCEQDCKKSLIWETLADLGLC